MCGRYSIIPKSKGKSKAVKLVQQAHVQARYNAAPSQEMPVITSQSPDIIQYYKWGLLPHWAKDATYKNKPINARSETLTEKPAFRSLLSQKRCLVPADSFYEWRKVGKSKKPYRILLKNENMFTFAGLWDEWVDKNSGEIQHSFTIITTEANQLIKPLHDRMPVILHPEEEKTWLTDTSDHDSSKILDLLKPYPAEEMRFYAVSELVNAAAHDTPDIITPEAAGLFD